MAERFCSRPRSQRDVSRTRQPAEGPERLLAAPPDQTPRLLPMLEVVELRLKELLHARGAFDTCIFLAAVSFLSPCSRTATWLKWPPSAEKAVGRPRLRGPRRRPRRWCRRRRHSYRISTEDFRRRWTEGRVLSCSADIRRGVIINRLTQRSPLG